MKNLLGLVAAVLLVGCASRAPREARIPYAAVSCADTAQCNALWSRAQVYLAQHGAFRMQFATDSILQTFGPQQGFPMLAFTVTKEAALDGSATITMDGRCGNMFGCTPDISEARQDFNRYLNAAKLSAMPATK